MRLKQNGIPLLGRWRTGFTILELLVAISIMSIVVAVSAPQMARMYDSMKYRGAIQDIASILSGTRYRAITTGESHDVLLFPEQRMVRHGERDRLFADSIDLQIVSARELNKSDAGVIRFYADGTSSGGTITIAHDSGMEAKIQVDWLLGRIDICGEDCSGPL